MSDFDDDENNEETRREEQLRNRPHRRSEFRHVGESVDDLMEVFGRMKAKQEATRLEVLASDCPKCATHDGPLAKACRWTTEEWCKHRDTIASAQAAAQLAAERLRNLTTAGVRHRGVLDTFPGATRCPDPKGLAGEAVAAARAPMSAAARFLRDPAIVNLLLFGTAGSGKTWAAAWIVAGTDRAKWLPFSSIAPNEDWNQLRRESLKADLVVVNDLGAGPMVPWRDAEVEAVIVERDDASLRTVVTTNLTPTTLQTRFGDRLMRRLTGASGLVVECIGPDLSKRPA